VQNEWSLQADEPTLAVPVEGFLMRKRATDLSVEELAALGANAALRAAREAQDAGLVVTGAVDFREHGQVVSSLAERHPSGTVSLVASHGAEKPDSPTSKTGKGASGKSSTD
jgi:hypothetical protein